MITKIPVEQVKMGDRFYFTNGEAFIASDDAEVIHSGCLMGGVSIRTEDEGQHFIYAKFDDPTTIVIVERNDDYVP